MNNHNHNHTHTHTQSQSAIFNCSRKCLLAGVFLFASASASVMASSQSGAWNPVASEKLIKLPASYMEKMVEKNFRDSPLAAQMSSVDQQAQQQVSLMARLKEEIKTATGEDKIEARHQLLAAKSAYLDAIEQQQKLEQQALATRSQLYQGVLSQLNQGKRQRQDPELMVVTQNQQLAQQRLKRTMAMMENLSIENPALDENPETSSAYNSDYDLNLKKISSLQQAIQKHAANSNSPVEGQPVNRVEYVRQLLGQVDAQQALLAQENQMLSFMAQLVALDAQALEMELTTSEIDASGHAVNDSGSLASTTELFIN